MEVYSNKASLTGTYGGNEVTNKSVASIKSTGNFMVKTGDRTYGDVGTVGNYTIMMSTGSLIPDDLKLTDVADEGLEFVEGSLTLNGVSKEGTISDLVIDYEADTSYTIKYQMKKTKAGTLNNFAYLTGTYCGDVVTIDSVWVMKDTGTVFLKTADRAYGDIGTITNYTIHIEIGDICPNDLDLSDVMDDGLEFVDGTLKLNGVSKTGTVDDLEINYQPNTTYDVTYQAIRVSVGN